MVRIALLLGLLCFFVVGNAQEDKLLKAQIETLFKDVRAAERKALVAECMDTWTSSFLSGAEKDSVSAVFKELQTMRMAPASDMRNFAECVNRFCRAEEKENLYVWLGALKRLVFAKDRRKNNVKNYLGYTRNFVVNGVLYAAPGHSWIVRGKGRWEQGEEVNVTFEDATVVCKTPKDSILIYNTRVSYELQGHTMEGNGGRVYWQSEDTLYAELSRYGVDMAVSDYSADSVSFVYERQYDRPLAGKLRDNALKYKVANQEELFPQFISYDTDIKIDSLFPGISFRGGIQYDGMKLSGFSDKERPACVHIAPNDTTHMYVYSTRFSIDTARVVSGTSRMVLPLGSGRFSHPNVNFAYTRKDHTVTVKRISEQSQHLPFRDDYHQILFSVEQLIWPVDSSYVTMCMNSRSGLFKAEVESLDFFNDILYDQMQGIDEIHPLNGLHKASVMLGTKTFSMSDYAGIMKKPIDQLRKQVISLSYDNFLDFDEASDEVTLKERLFHYTDARVGKQDYDNIRFASLPKNSRTNAVLDLRNYQLKIYGVEKFTISEAKDVYVEPSDKSVVMMKNRDMEFNGKLKAGMFDMYGNKLYFSYDKYTIGLTQVDSTGMYIADKKTGRRGRRVNSLIRDVTGDIEIDKPNNKSGKKDVPGYPIFHSTKESYVYFDAPSICNGVYKKEKFYFVIKPYTLKNINDSDKFRYAFGGILVSNIVPDIQDTLKLMADNSLGMKYQTPDQGLALYEKGNLKNRIELSQKGFIADGKVELNGSRFESSSILMMPDTMLSVTPLLLVDGVEGRRPGAKGEQVKVTYLKNQGNMLARSTKQPFSVYGDRIKHEGTLMVYDDLLDADGKLELKGARLTSRLFHLEANNILSDQTDLQLSSFANKNIQLNTANVQANIDLVQNKGKFMNNADANMADFPSNRYRCSFKSFTWYMNEAYLNIGIEDEKELQRIWRIEDVMRMPEEGKNLFVSTDKACDSLSFMAPLARYNLNTGDIQCQWVNHIDLANGRFYPDLGKINISGLGDIEEFKNGLLVCDRIDRSKQLTQVGLKLKGRLAFNGNGDYDYINQDKQRSVIHFTQIGVDTSRNIYAKVDMKPEAKFDLNRGITYKGNIYLYSKQKDLFFNGYVRLTADDTYLKHTWLKVKTYFAAQDIRVPVEIENRDDKGKHVYNGIFLNVDKTVKPYASYLSNRIFYNDAVLLGGHGELVWLEKEKKYLIRDTQVDPYYHLCYTPEQTTVSGFGRIGMEMDIPGIRQWAAGNVSYNLKEEGFKMENMLYVLDFVLLGKMESVMLRDFADKKRRAITPDASLVSKVTALYGKEMAPLAMKQLGKSSNNIPDSLSRFLVMDSLNINWDVQKRSYVANGKAIIRTVLKRPVEEEYNVAMELVRRRMGNQLYLYIYNDQKWYYFEYLDKSLFTLSSNAEYNDILRNEKADKKVIQNKEKQTLYTITLCPDSKKNRFLKRVGL